MTPQNKPFEIYGQIDGALVLLFETPTEAQAHSLASGWLDHRYGAGTWYQVNRCQYAFNDALPGDVAAALIEYPPSEREAAQGVPPLTPITEISDHLAAMTDEQLVIQAAKADEAEFYPLFAALCARMTPAEAARRVYHVQQLPEGRVYLGEPVGVPVTSGPNERWYPDESEEDDDYTTWRRENPRDMLRGW